MSEQTVPSFEASDRHLRKAIPLQHLLFLSVGAIIGSGWLFGSFKAAGVAGPAAIISWIVGGVFILLVSLTWAELSAMLPRTGAIVRYPHLTHGAFTGWIMGWAYWLSAVSVPAIESEAAITYIGGRWPQLGLMQSSSAGSILAWPKGIGLGVGFMLVFFVLNFFGVRLLTEWNRWFVWWKIVIPVVTFCFIFTIFRGQNFTAYGGFVPNGPASIFGALVTTGVIFAYLGFRQGLDYGGEAKNPQRDIPLATIGSLLITMAIYTVLQAAFIGGLNFHAAGVTAGAWSSLGKSSWSSGPLFQMLTTANLAALAAFGQVLLIDAVVSPSGTGWIYTGTSTRTYYGISVMGYFPRVFQWMNRFGIPWVALVGAFVLACIFFIPAPSWYLLVGFITSTTVLTYVMGGVGLPVLRRYAPDLRRPFKLAFAELWAPVSFLAAYMLVYWSGFGTLDNVFAAIMIGLPLFTWWYAWQRGWITARGPAWARPIAGIVLGLVFLGAWIYINKMGGWTLNSGTKAISGSWPFSIYDIAFSADVLFFCAVLWAICNAGGRRQIVRSAWVIWLVLATFPLSYYGYFGIGKAIGFPWGTLIAVGVGLAAYYSGVMSGFATDELKEILTAGGHDVGNARLPLLPQIKYLPARLGGRPHPDPSS